MTDLGGTPEHLSGRDKRRCALRYLSWYCGGFWGGCGPSRPSGRGILWSCARTPKRETLLIWEATITDQQCSTFLSRAAAALSTEERKCRPARPPVPFAHCSEQQTNRVSVRHFSAGSEVILFKADVKDFFCKKVSIPLEVFSRQNTTCLRFLVWILKPEPPVTLVLSERKTVRGRNFPLVAIFLKDPSPCSPDLFLGFGFYIFSTRIIFEFCIAFSKNSLWKST